MPPPPPTHLRTITTSDVVSLDCTPGPGHLCTWLQWLQAADCCRGDHQYSRATHSIRLSHRLTVTAANAAVHG
jgi:hypothetical protein